MEKVFSSCLPGVYQSVEIDPIKQKLAQLPMVWERHTHALQDALLFQCPDCPLA
jgi:hypothetical protein